MLRYTKKINMFQTLIDQFIEQNFNIVKNYMCYLYIFFISPCVELGLPRQQKAS